MVNTDSLIVEVYSVRPRSEATGGLSTMLRNHLGLICTVPQFAQITNAKSSFIIGPWNGTKNLVYLTASVEKITLGLGASTRSKTLERHSCNGFQKSCSSKTMVRSLTLSCAFLFSLLYSLFSPDHTCYLNRQCYYDRAVIWQVPANSHWSASSAGLNWPGRVGQPPL